MKSLSRKRRDRLNDIFHKYAKDLTMWLKDNGIGTLIIGHTPLWKQKSDIGMNSQTFMQIPFDKFFIMLMYLCEENGITCFEQEESYTSDASAVDGDTVPVYDKDDKTEYHFSGKRIKRGLYRTADGTLINADLNGAANIMRKAAPHCFDGCDMKQILRNVEVVSYADVIGTPKVTG